MWNIFVFVITNKIDFQRKSIVILCYERRIENKNKKKKKKNLMKSRKKTYIL